MRFKVLCWGRRAGKTLFSLNEIIKRGVKDPGVYWYITPNYKQAKQIAWRELKRLLKNDDLWKFNEVELKAEHPMGLVIELKGADNEDSLRGSRIKGAVLDECAFKMKPNVWPEIIRPMLADFGGWAVFISTPKGQNWFFDLYQRGLDENEPNWKSWHYPTSVNSYIAQEEIEQARKDMSERLFRQEFLAQFLDDETGVFRGIRQCTVGELKSKPTEGRIYYLGCDLAKHEDFTVLLVMDSVTREVVDFDRFQEISWVEQKDKILRMAKKWNNAITIVDSTGVGDAIYDDLQNCNISVRGVKFTYQTKNILINKLVVAIEQRLITFPEIPVLIEELHQFEHSTTPEGRIKYSAPSGRHDDCVIALALAVDGIKNSLYSAQIIQERQEAEVVDRQGYGESVYNYEFEDNITGY